LSRTYRGAFHAMTACSMGTPIVSATTAALARYLLVTWIVGVYRRILLHRKSIITDKADDDGDEGQNMMMPRIGRLDEET